MHRSISLSEEQWKWLAAQAQAERRSIGYIVRALVDAEREFQADRLKALV